jgi:hypothetical protein
MAKRAFSVAGFLFSDSLLVSNKDYFSFILYEIKIIGYAVLESRIRLGKTSFTNNKYICNSLKEES